VNGGFRTRRNRSSFEPKAAVPFLAPLTRRYVGRFYGVRSELVKKQDEIYARAIQRFELEAQATASLRCPHTI
jgi:hypothetical protein